MPCALVLVALDVTQQPCRDSTDLIQFLVQQLLLAAVGVVKVTMALGLVVALVAVRRTLSARILVVSGLQIRAITEETVAQVAVAVEVGILTPVVVVVALVLLV
jgi:hypothetical protein